jgi:hypothetical protein
MASLTVVQEANKWHGEGPTEKIVIKLEKNPFGVFRFMELDAHSNTVPQGTSKQAYNRKKVLNHLKSFKDPFAIFETAQDAPLKLGGSIAINNWKSSAELGMPNKKLVELRLEAKFINYAQELAALFPNFDRASIAVNSQMNEFYFQHNLDWLPNCFDNFLDWYHLLSPAAYEPYFEADELLEAPFYQAREVQIGNVICIEIISFENPLGFTQEPEETAARVIEINKYINAHRRDRHPVYAQIKQAQ